MSIKPLLLLPTTAMALCYAYRKHDKRSYYLEKDGINDFSYSSMQFLKNSTDYFKNKLSQVSKQTNCVRNSPYAFMQKKLKMFGRTTYNLILIEIKQQRLCFTCILLTNSFLYVYIALCNAKYVVVFLLKVRSSILTVYSRLPSFTFAQC